jgi:hypothetical protein
LGKHIQDQFSFRRRCFLLPAQTLSLEATVLRHTYLFTRTHLPLSLTNLSLPPPLPLLRYPLPPLHLVCVRLRHPQVFVAVLALCLSFIIPTLKEKTSYFIRHPRLACLPLSLWRRSFLYIQALFSGGLSRPCFFFLLGWYPNGERYVEEV